MLKTVYPVDGGDPVIVEAVDAKEYVASGQYTFAEPGTEREPDEVTKAAKPKRRSAEISG